MKDNNIGPTPDMEDNNIGPTPDKVYEDITDFDNSMFLVNPLRAMKFAEFLSYISEFRGLRVKLMRAGKDSSFWQMADAFKNAHSKDFKELGESNLAKGKNDFLNELEKNEEIDFSRNDIEEVKKALNLTFSLTQTGEVEYGMKDKLLKLVG